MIATATAPVIEFQEEGHVYRVNGVEKRYWSQIAIDAGLAPKMRGPGEPGYENYVNAKHRGRQVGEAAAILIRGQSFDPHQLANESIPYVQAFLDYWHRHAVVAVAETPLYCAELDFCITPDFHTRTHVFEIKTPRKRERSWALQHAAQALALGGRRGGIIWLRPHLKTRNHEVLLPPGGIYSPYDSDVVREACRGEYDGPAITAWRALQ